MFDFSNLTNTFYELQAERGGLFNPLNLVRLVGRGRDLLPRVVENMLDAKVELDGRLRKVISDFTAWEAGKTIAPLRRGGSGGGKGWSVDGRDEEDEIWDVDAFAEWTEVVFGVADRLAEDDDQADAGAGAQSQSRSLSRDGSV